MSIRPKAFVKIDGETKEVEASSIAFTNGDRLLEGGKAPEGYVAKAEHDRAVQEAAEKARAEEQKKKPAGIPEGATVLTGEEAARYEALIEGGDLSKVAQHLEDYTETKQALAKREHEDRLKKAFRLAGYDEGVGARRLAHYDVPTKTVEGNGGKEEEVAHVVTKTLPPARVACPFTSDSKLLKEPHAKG